MDRRKVLLTGWDSANWKHVNPRLEEGLQLAPSVSL
jgi:hypothetical protein